MVISSAEHSQTIELNVNEEKERERRREKCSSSRCVECWRRMKKRRSIIRLNRTNSNECSSSPMINLSFNRSPKSLSIPPSSPSLFHSFFWFRILLLWINRMLITLNCPFVISLCRSSTISIGKISFTSPSILLERFGSNEIIFIFVQSNEHSIDRSKRNIRNSSTNKKININWILHTSDIEEEETRESEECRI